MATWFEITYTGEPTEADWRRVGEMAAQGYTSGELTNEPESSEYCQLEFDGTDTDGEEWYRCTVHDELVIGDIGPCAGYQAPPYKERIRRTNNG